MQGKLTRMAAGADVTRHNRLIYDQLYARSGANMTFEVRNKTRVVRRLLRGLRLRVGTVLDIGFGTGANLMALSQWANRLIGIEPILTPIQAFRRSHPLVSFSGVVADAAALPFSDGTIDLVVLSHVLEHLPSDAVALDEIHRVVRPGGYALVLVPCRDLEENPLHERQYSPEALRDVCVQAGFAPVRQLAVGSRLIEAILRILLRLAGGLPAAQEGSAVSHGGQEAHRLLRWLYYRSAVPLLLAFSRLDDRLATLQREPLETAILVRRVSSPSSSNPTLRSAGLP